MRGPRYYVSLLFNGTAVWASSCLRTRDKLPGNCSLIGWLSGPSGQWRGCSTRKWMGGGCKRNRAESVRKFAVKSRKYPGSGWVSFKIRRLKGLFEYKTANKNRCLPWKTFTGMFRDSTSLCSERQQGDISLLKALLRVVFGRQGHASAEPAFPGL